MKLKVLLGATAWLLLITISHIALNIGFDKLAKQYRVMTGQERGELIVGFLPVT
ncbi:MAG: hypothetical protein P1V81_14550 [Planctomycetota bacterium]|nr:hypothetical protein [Planctomycetota bacterium]